MYGSYQISDRLYAGIAVNSPFGLTTKPDNPLGRSANRAYVQDHLVQFNPTLAYKITPQLSIGVGAQVEYLEPG